MTIIPGNIVQHVRTAQLGEVASTTRKGDEQTANVVWRNGTREKVDPDLLVKVGHVGNPKHLLRGMA